MLPTSRQFVFQMTPATLLLQSMQDSKPADGMRCGPPAPLALRVRRYAPLLKLPMAIATHADAVEPLRLCQCLWFGTSRHLFVFYSTNIKCNSPRM